jgi:hypothetical protein
MGKREENKGKKFIEESLQAIDIVKIQTPFGPIELISMEELPHSKMASFMKAPVEEKLSSVMALMETCLVDPKQWDKINTLPVKHLNAMIHQWLSLSGGPMDEN